MNPSHKTGEALFDALRPRLERVLLPHGFKTQLDQYDEAAFGSRLLVFESQDRAFQLIWDGKESMLILQDRRREKGQRPADWHDRLAQRFERASSPSIPDVVDSFVNAAESLL